MRTRREGGEDADGDEAGGGQGRLTVVACPHQQLCPLHLRNNTNNNKF